mgnify:CR=1 FL=1
MRMNRIARLALGSAIGAMALSGCASGGGAQLAPAQFVAMQEGPGEEYVIGPLDELTIYVWRNPELSMSVPVRPDGKLSTPLVDELVAQGKTSIEIARDVEKALSKLVRDPVVTVIVTLAFLPFGAPLKEMLVFEQEVKPILQITLNLIVLPFTFGLLFREKAPTITSGGGTSPTIVGSDMAFKITLGATPGTTAIVVDFYQNYTAAPMVIAQ